MRPKEARHTGMFSKQSVSGYVLIFHRLKCNIKMSKKTKKSLKLASSNGRTNFLTTLEARRPRSRRWKAGSDGLASRVTGGHLLAVLSRGGKRMRRRARVFSEGAHPTCNGAAVFT